MKKDNEKRKKKKVGRKEEIKEIKKKNLEKCQKNGMK